MDMAQILIDIATDRVRDIRDVFDATYQRRAWQVVDVPGKTVAELQAEMASTTPEVIMVETGGEVVPAYQRPSDGKFYLYEAETGDFKT